VTPARLKKEFYHEGREEHEVCFDGEAVIHSDYCRIAPSARKIKLRVLRVLRG
jgi:hypothetical protein